MPPPLFFSQVRREMGQDIAGACGQLVVNHSKTTGTGAGAGAPSAPAGGAASGSVGGSPKDIEDAMDAEFGARALQAGSGAGASKPVPSRASVAAGTKAPGPSGLAGLSSAPLASKSTSSSSGGLASLWMALVLFGCLLFLGRALVMWWGPEAPWHALLASKP
jgi:hypothetical protein